MFRTVFSIRWRAKGRVVSWPDRPNGAPSYPAPPRPAAPPCAAPTRPARGVSGFWIRQVRSIIGDVLVDTCADSLHDPVELDPVHDEAHAISMHLDETSPWRCPQPSG